MNQLRPIISLIWAMAENRVIGRDNRLPWHLSADLKHFKELTLGKPILMGRKTWESLPGLLPNRAHFVLTRDKSYQAAGCSVVHSIDDLLAAVNDSHEVMVMGGALLYQQMLPLAGRLYITLVHAKVDGDAYFPDFDSSLWLLMEREDHPADEKNDHAYSFLTLHRK